MADLPVDPISDPLSWDSFEFAGVEWPWCEYSGFDRKYEWDVKKGKGAQGASATYVGEDLADGTITFYAWTKSQFDQFKQLRRLFAIDPTKGKSIAIEIWHPALVDNDVNSVVAQEIGAWKHKGDGMYTRDVKFLEYRPPPKVSAVSTPTGAAGADPNKNGTPGLQPDPAIKAAQDDFSKSLADAKSLGPP